MASSRVHAISSPIADFDKTFADDFKHLYQVKEQQTKDGKFSSAKFFPVVDNYLIAKAFYFLFRIMQFLGSLPIRIKASKGTIRYEFKPCSFIFVYSWLCVLSLTVMFFAFILNREFHTDWPFQIYIQNNDTNNLFRDSADSPSWVSGLDRVLRIIVPTFAMINLVAVRFRVRSIIQFVNGWASLLKEYETIFGPYYKIRLVTLERAHWFIIPFLIVNYMIPIIQINVNEKRFLLTDNWFLNFWSKTMFTIFIVSAYVLSTVVTVLSLMTIKCFYGQIRKAITCQYEENGNQLTRQHVKDWIKLVTLVRDQVDLFVRFGGLPELNDLLFTFISVLTLLYMVISLYIMQTTAGSMVYYALGILVGAFMKTYLKGQLGDMIRNEEHLTGLDVLGMQVTNSVLEITDCDEAYNVRFEMSVLCNMIFTSPVQIRFGNIISLNKRLLLLIVSHLASYLVVFLQFRRNPH